MISTSNYAKYDHINFAKLNNYPDTGGHHKVT
jgi:hypothetical protein